MTNATDIQTWDFRKPTSLPDDVEDRMSHWQRGLCIVLAERTAVPGETIAYRCVGTHCELPVKSWEALAALL